MIGDVFCDHLTTTIPADDWDALRAELSPLFDAIGAAVEFDTDRMIQWRAGAGTCRAARVGAVVALSATGAFLAGLRCARIFNDYVASIGAHPHRVTRLDASRDVPCDTAPVLAALTEKVSSAEGVHVTRKRVKPEDCTRYVSRRPDGQDTGSLYLGPKHADVRPVIYDKRKERIDAGLADVGPLTRYELRVRSGVGPSLRDACEPGPLFWHFMAPDVLGLPEGIAAWTPHGEGFALERREPPLPAARLVRRVEASADVAALLALADEVGPGGFDFLVSQLRKLHGRQGRGVGAAAPTETASPALVMSESL